MSALAAIDVRPEDIPTMREKVSPVPLAKRNEWSPEALVAQYASVGLDVPEAKVILKYTDDPA